MSIPPNMDSFGMDRNYAIAVSSHPGLIDLFVTQARKEMERQPRTSVREQLRQAQKETGKKAPATHKKRRAGAMNRPKRKRDVQLNFRVSAAELAAIEDKMAALGIFNREAYLRKMALDGYAVKLDLPELKELLSLLRRSSSNLNQLARRVNATGRIYEADIADLTRRQEELLEGVRAVLLQLANIS